MSACAGRIPTSVSGIGGMMTSGVRNERNHPTKQHFPGARFARPGVCQCVPTSCRAQGSRSDCNTTHRQAGSLLSRHSRSEAGVRPYFRCTSCTGEERPASRCLIADFVIWAYAFALRRQSMSRPVSQPEAHNVVIDSKATCSISSVLTSLLRAFRTAE